MHKRLSAACLSLALTVGAVEANAEEFYSQVEYPRLAGMLIANKNYAEREYKEALSRLDMVVFQFVGAHDAWSDQSMASILSDIKARNPDLVALQYVILNEQYLDSPAWPGVGRKLEAEKWWLYEKGGSGTIVAGESRTKFGETNYTRHGPRDRNGLNYAEWFAKWTGDVYFQNTPQWDGLYIDNFWLRPRHNGDWNRDGTTDQRRADNVVAWHQEGMANFVRAARSQLPGKLITGNIGEWGQANAQNEHYRDLLDGGFLEHFIGKSWSPEGKAYDGSVNNWGSWDVMMQRYRRVVGRINNRSNLMFNQLGRPTDYQSFRYGFASCLMDDAHFSYSNPSRNYGTVEWFDEFDLAGTSDTKWLGRPIDAPQLSAWKDGVYRRRFENGMVLVNPRGNGQRTVDVGEGYKRFVGGQAPGVNDGTTASRITLRDRDAIFLVKKRDGGGPPAPPEAPVLTLQ